MLPLEKITETENIIFTNKDEKKMQETTESIKKHGILVPAIVREKEGGNYEMVDGYRRKEICQVLGIDKIPCVVRKLDEDEAIIIRVDTNLNQRETILPSEKAFAYKMKMEAMKRQGMRNDLTSSQVGTKLRTDEIIAKENGESRNQIQRYIRLTELVSEILDIVDNGRIAFNPAVEISYLKEDEQYDLLDCINKYASTPSQAQAIKMKNLSKEGNLTKDIIEEIMEEEKENQKPKYNINYDRFQKYLPRNIVTKKEVEDYLYKCVKEHYVKVMTKRKSMER